MQDLYALRQLPGYIESAFDADIFVVQHMLQRHTTRWVSGNIDTITIYAPIAYAQNRRGLYSTTLFHRLELLLHRIRISHEWELHNLQSHHFVGIAIMSSIHGQHSAGSNHLTYHVNAADKSRIAL